MDLIPGWGSKISHAARCSPPQKGSKAYRQLGEVIPAEKMVLRWNCVSEHQKGGSSAGGVGKMLATVVEEEVGDYG